MREQRAPLPPFLAHCPPLPSNRIAVRQAKAWTTVDGGGESDDEIEYLGPAAGYKTSLDLSPPTMDMSYARYELTFINVAEPFEFKFALADCVHGKCVYNPTTDSDLDLAADCTFDACDDVVTVSQPDEWYMIRFDSGLSFDTTDLKTAIGVYDCESVYDGGPPTAGGPCVHQVRCRPAACTPARPTPSTCGPLDACADD